MKDLVGLLNQLNLNISYASMPAELRNTKEGLINIRKDNQKCFLWCHIILLNPKIYTQKELQDWIKNWLMVLIMKELVFLCLRKILARLKWKIVFVSMFFVTKRNWRIQFFCLNSSLKIPWICYLYPVIMHKSKILTDLRLIKQSIKTKNTFLDAAYSVLTVKKCWMVIKKLLEHKWYPGCKIKKRFIEFKNYFK